MVGNIGVQLLAVGGSVTLCELGDRRQAGARGDGMPPPQDARSGETAKNGARSELRCQPGRERHAGWIGSRPPRATRGGAAGPPPRNAPCSAKRAAGSTAGDRKSVVERK